MFQELFAQIYQCSCFQHEHILPCAIAVINWPYCKMILVVKKKYYCIYVHFALLRREHPLDAKAASKILSFLLSPILINLLNS